MKKPRLSANPKVHLASLGCAKNLVDSESLLARLATAGAIVGADADEADVIIVNTCGFIQPAKEESIRTIEAYRDLRQDNDDKKLIVMGCLPERCGDELRAELPWVDAMVGLGAHEEILALCGLSSLDDASTARLLLTPAHSAYLRISDGCDNNCSYCTIPRIRGRFHSRSPEAVLAEAHDLVRSGARELVVIGQDTTSYGKDLSKPYALHRLLRDLSNLDDLRWIRLLYTHPAHFTDQLIEEYAENSKLCAYVDIPLQHLHDEMLQRMGRRVTQAECLDLIDRLRDRVPGMALRTTFIIGFPGETDEQFNELLRCMREIRFDHVGAFAYSAEPDTRAAGFSGQVPPAVTEERIETLMLEQQAIVFERNQASIGKTVEVLIDGPADEEDVWVGRTFFQAPDVDSVTFVEGANCQPGAFVEAKIIGSQEYDLVARA